MNPRHMRLCMWHLTTHLTLGFLPSKSSSNDRADKLLSINNPYMHDLSFYFNFRFTVVHRTEVIKKTLNPTWRPFTISVRSLCNGDYDRYYNIETHYHIISIYFFSFISLCDPLASVASFSPKCCLLWNYQMELN